MLVLDALGIGPGDEVITTPFTFFATAESISRVGATPVFVDIDPGTFNLDASELRSRITPRTKAILPVHIFGQPADMDEVMEVAKEVPVCGSSRTPARRSGRSTGGGKWAPWAMPPVSPFSHEKSGRIRRRRHDCHR